MTSLVPSPTVAAAADALGVGPGSLRPVGGGTGETWGTGPYFIRVRPTPLLNAELAAMAAAGTAVPVADVVELAEVGGVSAALLRRLPGALAGSVEGISVTDARRRGRACGALHRRLASVQAPDGCPPAHLRGHWPKTAAAPPGHGLLHLDLHPLNVLVDGDVVTGVIDWANARAGEPALDRARTLSILTLDPAIGPWREDPRVAALLDGWIEGGELEGVADGPKAWAYRFMLDDLAPRCRAAQLAPIRAALAALDDPADRASRN